MRQPKHASLIHKKVQTVFARSKLTYAEAAKASGLSLNTVKRILTGFGAHANSCLQLERALEDHINDPKSAQHQGVLLTNDNNQNADLLLIAYNKQLQTMLENQDNLPSKKQLAMWRAVLRSVDGNLAALDASLDADSQPD